MCQSTPDRSFCSSLSPGACSGLISSIWPYSGDFYVSHRQQPFRICRWRTFFRYLVQSEWAHLPNRMSCAVLKLFHGFYHALACQADWRPIHSLSLFVKLPHASASRILHRQLIAHIESWHHLLQTVFPGVSHHKGFLKELFSIDTGRHCMFHQDFHWPKS